MIILDAGSDIRALRQALMREFRDKPLHLTMLVTHTHWDHIQDFLFQPAYNPKVEVRILGYEGAVHAPRSSYNWRPRTGISPEKVVESRRNF
jgi:phosphoribosyl 1,2-cyclic phosphodiesterase